MRNISDEKFGEIQNTHIMFNNFSPKIMPSMSSEKKNIAQPDTSHAGKLRLQTQTQNM